MGVDGDDLKDDTPLNKLGKHASNSRLKVHRPATVQVPPGHHPPAAFLLRSYTGYSFGASRNRTSPPIPVIIFAYNRADNLRQTIDSVLAGLPSPPSRHPIFISQDGDDEEVAKVIASYGQRLTHIHYHYRGPLGKTVVTPYFRIAEHYQAALTEVMDRARGHGTWNRVIMLEDDMLISPDLFSYFRRMAPLFDADASLYCVSAWNENGQEHFVHDPTAIYRTDCFSGLGWMWSRDRWEETRAWTPVYWDDWLREPAQRKGRSCIYPEISRVYTFGREGVGRGLFFDRWYRDIQLNRQAISWDKVDVNWLRETQYNDWLTERLLKAVMDRDVEKAKTAIDVELDLHDSEKDERVLTYRGLGDLTDIMEATGMNFDHKAGVPRASYKVLSFRYRGCRIWVVPADMDLPVG